MADSMAPSETATAVPPVSRTASSTRKSPNALGTRSPGATVRAPGHGPQLKTVIDTIGLTGGWSPVEPENGLLEKLKTPPSSATIR